MNSSVVLNVLYGYFDVKKDTLKWSGSLEDLKAFVLTVIDEETAETTTWRSPSGGKWVFESKPLVVTWQMKSKNIYFEGQMSTALEDQVKTHIESKLESGNDELMSDAEQQQQQSLDDSTLSSRCEPDASVPSDIHTKENDVGAIKSYPISVDNSSQTYEARPNEHHLTQGGRDCACRQASRDIESLKSIISKLQSSVDSFEIILKDHDSVLSMYNRSADLNEKYLKEINESKQHILYLEQKLLETKQEKDSLQLATRLIAQDKYCQHVISQNEVAGIVPGRKGNVWQKVHITNKNAIYDNNEQPTTTDISSKNRFELLINEHGNNSACQPEQQHNHENSQASNTQLIHDRTEHSESNANNDQSNDEQIETPRVNPNNEGRTSFSGSPIVIIGDSIIKNINPKKISKKQVVKRTFPGKTAVDIKSEVKSIPTVSTPSHVLIHAGTNDIPTHTAKECVKNIEELAVSVKKRFPDSRIGLSGITARYDIDVNTKILEVNSKLKEVCTKHDIDFIDNKNIDNSCLNGSQLHLNPKGSAYLAVNFIKFIRGNTPQSHYQNQPSKDFRLPTQQQHLLEDLVRILMTPGRNTNRIRTY